MVKQLTLPIAEGAALVLEKLTDIEMASSWRCTLVHGDTRAVLGEAMLSRCMQGLSPLADPASIRFSPKTQERDESAYVMAFSDQQGPNSSLYVFRAGDALELAWEDRQKMHREGILLDPSRVATWPQLLDDAAAGEIWPPSKYYRMMRERGDS